MDKNVDNYGKHYKEKVNYVCEGNEMEYDSLSILFRILFFFL